jgi:ABC-2 type transport system ATP-binding protein
VLHKGQIKANGTVNEVLKLTNVATINEAFSRLTQGQAV